MHGISAGARLWKPGDGLACVRRIDRVGGHTYVAMQKNVGRRWHTDGTEQRKTSLNAERR